MMSASFGRGGDGGVGVAVGGGGGGGGGVMESDDEDEKIEVDDEFDESPRGHRCKFGCVGYRKEKTTW